MKDSKVLTIHQGEINQDETINKLISVVGNRRKILCVGTSTLTLAKTLTEEHSCEVSVIIDPKDYLHLEKIGDLKIILESVNTLDLAKRFSPDDFEVIFIADTLQQVHDYSKILAGLIGFFANSLVISVPQLLEDKKALILAQSKEIKRLKAIIEQKEEGLAWYSKRMREHLANHYKLEKTAKERIDYEKSTQLKLHGLSETIAQKKKAYKALEDDRDRILAELHRVRNYSPDCLPFFLKYPLKGLISIYSQGIFHPFRALKKKVGASQH